MKRLFTTFFILLLAIRLTFAVTISKGDAQVIAENFYRAQVSNESISISVKNVNEYSFEGETTMYIFSFIPSGFVIVSSEDLAYPIIGYSLTNTANIDNNSPEIINRLNFYSKQIKEGKKFKGENLEVKRTWDRYKTKSSSKIQVTVAPLLTTTWNQSPIYNRYCPNSSPTGCVATAMAQIMNYHKWPVTGQGWYKYTPRTNPSYGTQYADFSTVTYNYLKMPNNLTELSTIEEKDAVSTLMYHAGVSVSMDYATDGSAAYSNDVMYALTSYFKYDPTTINTYYFDANKVAEWLALVKNELNQGRPVYYSGSTIDKDGHAWVCDGYDASDNLHINWGWGGNMNGYFAPSAMSPHNSSGSGYSFTENNSIIIGIKPGTTTQSILWIQQNSSFTAKARGIESISAVNDRVAWAVAYDGSGGNARVKDFTKTIDGGSTWVSGTINASGTFDYSTAMISAVSDKKAWVALWYVNSTQTASTGVIVNTTDGGNTWVTQSTAAFSTQFGFPNVVHFWDENNGFCMGDPSGVSFEIFTTTNGGTNWTRVSSNNIPAPLNGEAGTVGLYSVYGNTVWFATNKGRIFKSTDKGYHWQAFQTPITDASFEISFKDDNTGIIQRRASTGTNSSYITTNGGQNWTLLNPTGNFYQASFKFIPGSNLLISTGVSSAAPGYGISYSTNNGTTFTDYAPFYKNYQFTAIDAKSDKSIWAGSFNLDKYYGGFWHLGTIPISADFVVNKTLAYQNDSSVIFSNNSFGSPDTWIWNFGDGASPSTKTGAGPFTIKYSTVGNKTVTLTIKKGTEEVIYVKENALTVTWPVGVDNSLVDKQYNLYPNPASTIIRINGYEKGRVKVYSTTGALVLELERLPEDNTLNISNLSNGVYFINIQDSDSKVVTKKLIISK